MVGVTYHVSAVPAEVVDTKTRVEESPVAVPVVVWHALHLQRTTSEHFDNVRSRTSIEVLSGTSGRAEQVLRWCVSLPPACVQKRRRLWPERQRTQRPLAQKRGHHSGTWLHTQ